VIGLIGAPRLPREMKSQGTEHVGHTAQSLRSPPPSPDLALLFFPTQNSPACSSTLVSCKGVFWHLQSVCGGDIWVPESIPHARCFALGADFPLPSQAWNCSLGQFWPFC
jgi:hypothetical protein